MATQHRGSIDLKSGVTVLTLVKGRAAHLARLIEGLRRSEVLPLEVIVVDMDGGWVAPVVPFPIRIISMVKTGLPLAAARNAAARAANSDCLLFLDVDCIPMQRLLGVIDRHIAETAALVCVDVRYLGAAQFQEPWTDIALWRMAHPHPARVFPEQGLRLEPNYGLFWSLAFAIRRPQFFDLGGFDETFTGYGAEDTDFGFRAEAAGIPLMFLGGSGAVHQHHAVFDPPFQHFSDIVQNARRFHDKWRTWPMLGWLQLFAARGLIDFCVDHIEIIRLPTPAEVRDAQVRRPF